MTGTHLDSPTSALHALSQISFRLSQRPPSSQRKSRRQLDRVESIEDSEVLEHMIIGTPSQENSAERHNKLMSIEKRTAKSIFDCTEPPTLSSPILSFASTAPQTQQKEQERTSILHIRDRNKTTLKSKHTLRSIVSPISKGGLAGPLHPVNPPYLLSYSPRHETGNVQSTTPQNAKSSSLRPVFTHVQEISSWSSTPSDRDQGAVPSGASALAAQAAENLVSSLDNLKTYSTSIQSTPSKRPRREGAVAAEIRKAITQEASEFCMWWHCLNSELGPSRVCLKPQASFRLRVQRVQSVFQPHLFCVETDVVEMVYTGPCSSLATGKPLTALLSVAACMDAFPREAQKILDNLMALRAEPDDADSPLFVSVYEPWRMQGSGEQLCLFASRFVISRPDQWI